MKLRLIEISEGIVLLCTNGTIMVADDEVLSKLLTSFAHNKRFKGTHGYWNNDCPTMEDVRGRTLAIVDDANHLIVYDEKVFKRIAHINEYISITEYADKHGKSRSIVKKLCAAGRIEGIKKNSTGWLIPADAPYPERKKRTTKEKQ